MPNRITLVVACALVDADNRVLIAKRPLGRHMAGLWEFPGGKIEPGERPEDALIRELAEELGIDVTELKSAKKLQDAIKKAENDIAEKDAEKAKAKVKADVLTDKPASAIVATTNAAKAVAKPVAKATAKKKKF